MSVHKKFRRATSHAEETSANTDLLQPDFLRPVKDKLAMHQSLKERARLMLDYPFSQETCGETDFLQMQTMQTEESITTLYRTLHDQSVSTSQMCMDVELRAIAAIEERITAELRLVEADYACIGMEVRARKIMSDKLQEAGAAVVAAREKENAVMNELDLVKPGAGIDEGNTSQKIQGRSQKRLNAEIRALEMQRIRMNAEQCAIREIESLVAQDDVQAFEAPNQYMSEEAILKMALENGMLATQDNACATQDSIQAQDIEAETEANRLLDHIRNASRQNFLQGAPTLH